MALKSQNLIERHRSNCAVTVYQKYTLLSEAVGNLEIINSGFSKDKPKEIPDPSPEVSKIDPFIGKEFDVPNNNSPEDQIHQDADETIGKSNFLFIISPLNCDHPKVS